MPRFSEHVTDIGDRAIAQAVAQYGKLPPALAQADPSSLKRALRQAQGNIHRLTVEEDGGIIVWNTPKW